MEAKSIVGLMSAGRILVRPMGQSGNPKENDYDFHRAVPPHLGRHRGSDLGIRGGRPVELSTSLRQCADQTGWPRPRYRNESLAGKAACGARSLFGRRFRARTGPADRRHLRPPGRLGPGDADLVWLPGSLPLWRYHLGKVAAKALRHPCWRRAGENPAHGRYSRSLALTQQERRNTMANIKIEVQNLNHPDLIKSVD